MRGRYWQRKGGGWAIAFYVDGIEYRESVARAIGKPWDQVTEGDAKGLLAHRVKEIAQDRFVTLEEAKRPFRELFADYRKDVTLRGRKGPTEFHAGLVVAQWGATIAANITSTAIRKWISDLQGRGYAPGTCQIVVSYLRAALRLAHAEHRLGRVPKIPSLKVQNARQGFFEPEEFAAIHARLTDPVNDLVAFYYHTGWRRQEVLGLRWSWVERGRRIVLPDSKNGEGRVVPLVGKLAELIEARWSKREYRRRDKTTALAEYVFHRAGKPVRAFERQWAKACADAGVHRLVHDFRRTVMRDGVQAGNDLYTVMALTGHKSIETARRYNIIDTRRVAAAMTLTDAWRADTGRTRQAAGEGRA